MSGRGCDEILGRLLDGVRPADDEAVAQHVRSCLGCFRTVNELRDLPRIAGRLAEDAPDPGPAFWEGFSARVADAWEAERRPARSRVVQPTVISPWRALVDWVNRPFPAALAGAAVAGLLVFATVRPLPVERVSERGTELDGAAGTTTSTSLVTALENAEGQALDEVLSGGSVEPDEVVASTEAALEELVGLDTEALSVLAKNLGPR